MKYMKRLILSISFIFPLILMSKVIDNLNDKTIEWIPFSDQVMGGISEVNFVERKENGLSYYHMEGNVSTENNGGFIQFRAEVEIDNAPYKGIKIKTRGNGEEYYHESVRAIIELGEDLSGSKEISLPAAYDGDDLEIHLIHEVVLPEVIDEGPDETSEPDEEDDEDSGLPSISFIAVLSVIMVAAFTAQRKQQ